MLDFFAGQYDIVVVGAGHAGIEAALAAARLGASTLCLCTSLEGIGNMPCNPSIGGTGKGHLVFEIDALGGEMGYAADLATLQSRTLNLGKGAAVHSKRVQADRALYKNIMKKTLEGEKNLRLVQAEICELVTEGEILDAIHRPLGARSLDGVKRRVRAGMGRCQGGFCAPRVMEIISRELGVAQTDLTKSGGGSRLLVGHTKEVR